MDKQTLGYIFGAAALFLFYWFKIRNPYGGKKDRRQGERRSGIRERRKYKMGRRKSNQLLHESQLEDRRHQRSDRRTGERTRRHKKRRKDDR